MHGYDDDVDELPYGEESEDDDEPMPHVYGSERFRYLCGDIKDTMRYGQHISEAVTQYMGLTSILTSDARKRLLEEAYRQILIVEKSISGRAFTIRQFVAYHAFTEEDDEWGDIRLLEGPSHVKGPLCNKTVVQRILDGASPLGLAKLLANTILAPFTFKFADVVAIIRTALLGTVQHPEQAAALASLVNRSTGDIHRFETTANVLLTDAHIFPRADMPRDRGLKRAFQGEVELLRVLAEDDARARREMMDQIRGVASIDALASRFGFQETSTGLFIPIRKEIVVAGSLREALVMAERDKASLLQMSPRKFEEFMAFIFSSLGFDVELTKCTRDGGADLLCLKDLHGIPFRLAVEVKRYKENRPITVSLVRSFIGANMAFNANRLLYVTTSGYTGPARQFADNCAAHTLTLAQYEQIQEWCAEVRSHLPPLL